MLKRFGRYLLRFFTVMGFFSVLSTLITLTILLSFKPKLPAVPEDSVLLLDFRHGVHKAPSSDPFAFLFEPEALDLFSFTEAIRKAATDDRIHGIVADVSFANLDFAAIHEIHGALARFKESGKFAYAFADTFDEATGSTGRYLLAAAFDEIWLQPSGGVGIIGFAAEVPFVRDAMEQFDIQPDFIKFKEYKTAVNHLTESGFTPAHRQQIEQLITGMERAVDDLFAARPQEKRGEKSFRAVADEGPYLAQAALDAGLVDKLAYRDELHDFVTEKVAAIVKKNYENLSAKDLKKLEKKKEDERDNPLLSIAQYQRSASQESLENRLRGQEDRKTIAMIYGTGPIMRDQSQNPLGGSFDSSQLIVARKLADAFYDAAKDDAVEAIVFRIDSPGGSYTASDTVRRAILAAKESGKKIIISMGSVAASGGYYLSMDGDTVLATPSTVTGSIGVFGGKVVLGGLAERYGVKIETVAGSPNALMWSGMKRFNESERAAFEKAMTFVYDDFTAKVAAGREEIGDVEKIAGGRIFTGLEAEEAGLIDGIGTLRDAVEAAKVSIGLDPQELVNVQLYPRTESPMEALRQYFSTGGASVGIGGRMLPQSLQQWLAWFSAMQAGGVQLLAAPVVVQ